MTTNETRQSTAHYVLEGLNEIGIEYLFCNLGTDHAPLIEEMARRRRLGRPMPKTVLCPHENTAVHMAAGYAIATGRGQAVLVHVDAGTANAAMGLHNLFRARLPLLLMAGRAPFTTRGELPGSRDTYVNFVQEPFDQASVVRPYVKWEYNLPSGVVAREALSRAHGVAHSDPKGPVYLMFARETLIESWPDSAAGADLSRRRGAVAARGADPATIDAIVERLLGARNPLLITAYAGRNPATAATLDALARFAGIRVISFGPVYLNIPHDSPCFGGFVPGAHVAEADVGLLVDVDVPWIPRDTPENPATWWAHIDVDAEKRGFPMWSFPGDLRLQGDSGIILAQILEALKARAGDAFRTAAAGRVARLAAEHDARQANARKLAADPGGDGRINPHFLCAAIGRAIGPQDIVLNEAIRNAPAVFAQIPRSVGGSLVGLAGGGLGFSGGVALGMKLAQPERTVVQVVGDGTFYFSNPQSMLAVSKQHGLPIFTVVLDNGGWSAVKEATLRVFPDGEARASDEFEARLVPDMNFAKVAEAAGAYGELLTDPAEVEAAVARCLAAVRGGRTALLHARVTRL
ncbi:MAG: thiamine pyrophosphate-requiring protein [Alphaproteobacteria bacterium]|nr:thiamine pyrophosphate-requiring protein [Alphaproteobacteria bacterium]